MYNSCWNGTHIILFGYHNRGWFLLDSLSYKMYSSESWVDRKIRTITLYNVPDQNCDILGYNIRTSTQYLLLLNTGVDCVYDDMMMM
jgi:hypothetical protein